MDFTQIAQQLLGLGLPILGNALGGPLGGLAASAVAKALGAKDSSPGSIMTTLQATDKDVAIQKLKSAEAEYVASVEAQAKVAMAQLTQTGETMRAEIASADKLPEGYAKTFIVVGNAIWRPLFAIEFLFECMFLFFGGVTGILHAIAVQQYSDIDNALKLMPMITILLLPYLAARFGILGYHMKLRTDEKEMIANVAAGEAPGGSVVSPDMISNIIKAVTGKR